MTGGLVRPHRYSNLPTMMTDQNRMTVTSFANVVDAIFVGQLNHPSSQFSESPKDTFRRPRLKFVNIAVSQRLTVYYNTY